MVATGLQKLFGMTCLRSCVAGCSLQFQKWCLERCGLARRSFWPGRPARCAPPGSLGRVPRVRTPRPVHPDLVEDVESGSGHVARIIRPVIEQRAGRPLGGRPGRV